MMLHVTYCSREKDRTRKNLPAIERYDSERIERIKALAEERDEDFAILSGKYGLIKAQEEIPFYDELLRQKDIPELINEVKNFLQSENIEKVVYHTEEVEGERRPYYKLIKNACDTLNIEIEKKFIQDS
ncbi:MAG: DUF6884 domain-containing protein [Candidatus Nanohaloarchaea archaeon]